MIKLKLLLCFFLLFFCAIIVKLFHIQVLSSKGNVSTYLSVKSILPERGRIFDRSMEPIVVNQSAYLLFLEPKRIENKHELVEKLSETLKLEEASIEAKIDETKDWIALQHNVDQSAKDKLVKMKLAGIGFQEQRRRYYPESSLSAHLVGFVGKNKDGESVGYFGLEGFYDKELTGLYGIVRSERDLIGRPIFVGTQERVEPEDGRDLVLTIDKAVQNIVKKKLAAGMESYQAKEGCVIVARPQTMEILSMVCLPDFDPDKYYAFSEEFFKNPAITNLYEPGSTFKPLVVAAGIEEKAIKPDEFYNEEGPVIVGGYAIRTWNNKYEGKVSITRILEKSSNVGMVYIGDKLGHEKLYEYVNKFGFGQLTNIDVQGEVASYMRPNGSWHDIDYATTTFGQGIAVTPIQMVQAFSSIINGGKLMRPYVVQAIKGPDSEKKREPKMVREVVSKRTSDILKKMLVSTVEHGEFQWVKPKGYVMGGKTGTAQVAIEGHYDPSKTIASFIGFAPADDPKFIALVVLREPQSSIWGSETAAPLFFEIAKDLLAYYSVAPKPGEN